MKLKFLSDVLSFLICTFFCLTYDLNYVKFFQIQYNYLITPCFLAFFILCVHNYEGYKLKTQFSRLSEVTAMIKAAILYIPAILLISYILKIEFIQSLNLISVLIFSFSIIFLPSLLRVLLNKIIPTSIKIDNTVIIGVGEMGKSFLNLHSLVNVRKFNIIGTVDDNIKKGTKFLNYKILGGIKNLSEIFSLNKTNRAIVAIRNIDEEKNKLY